MVMNNIPGGHPHPATPVPGVAAAPAAPVEVKASKQMLLLPTFDGQTRGAVAVNPGAIDLIKPAVSPGLTNVYLSGDHNTNFVTVDMDMGVLIEKLRGINVMFTDLTGGRKIVGAVMQEDGH